VNPLSGRARILLALPAIGWAAAIFVASSLSAERLPSTGVPSGDKVLHVAEYAVLGLLLLLPVRDLGWRGRGLALALGSAYAVLDELHQSFVPNRFADAGDVVMDVAGLLVAVAVHMAVWPPRPAAEETSRST
jgi:VanZ family protein